MESPVELMDKGGLVSRAALLALLAVLVLCTCHRRHRREQVCFFARSGLGSLLHLTSFLF